MSKNGEYSTARAEVESFEINYLAFGEGMLKLVMLLIDDEGKEQRLTVECKNARITFEALA
jgi:hypothetical protein